MTRRRRAVMLLLLIVAVIGVPLTVAVRWVDRTVLDSNAFVDHAERALDRPGVQDALAERLTDAVIEAEPALALARDAVEEGARVVVSSDQARALMTPALRELHGDLVAGQDELSLDLDPLLKPLRAAVRRLDSVAVAAVPTANELPQIVVLQEDQAPELWRAVSVGNGASILVPVLTLLALTVGLALARNRLLATALTAASAGALAAVLALVLLAGENRAEDGGSDQLARRAIAEIADAFGQDLVESLWITAAAAALLALISGVAAVIRRSRSGSEPTPA